MINTSMKVGKVRAIELRATLSLVIITTLLAGCASWITGPSHPQTLYVFGANNCDSKIEARHGAPSLLIGPPKGSAFLYSTRIIFSREPQTRGSYQYAFWTDAPPDRLAINLEQELDCRGTFSKVSRNSFPADYILRFEVIDFRHDISQSPGEISVELNAELINAHNGALLAKQHFVNRTPAPSFDATGAVDGLNTAGKKVVSELAEWLTNTVKDKKA